MKRSKRNCIDRRSGITLVEILVALAIVLVLLAIAFPGIQMVREASRRTACTNNVRQLVLGTLSYESTRQVYPIGVHTPRGISFNDTRELFNWAVDIAEYVDAGEETSGWLAKDGSTIVDVMALQGDEAMTRLKTMRSWLRCPSDSNAPELNDIRSASTQLGDMVTTNYVAANNVGICHALRNSVTRKAPNGMFHGIESETEASLKDGTSHTVMYSERIFGSFRAGQPSAGAGLQFGCRGVGNALDPSMPGFQDCSFSAAGGVNRFETTNEHMPRHGVSSGHSGGVVVGMADGAVRFVDSKVESFYNSNATIQRPGDPAQYGVWERMIAINDGQATE